MTTAASSGGRSAPSRSTSRSGTQGRRTGTSSSGASRTSSSSASSTRTRGQTTGSGRSRTQTSSPSARSQSGSGRTGTQTSTSARSGSGGASSSAQSHGATVNLPFVTAEFHRPDVQLPGREDFASAAETVRSQLPTPKQALFYGGLAAGTALSLLEWPVALAIGVGTAVVTSGQGGQGSAQRS